MRPQTITTPLILVLQAAATAAAAALPTPQNTINNILSPLSAIETTPPPTSQQIDAAARAWQNDTRLVSNFLSTAASLRPDQLQHQGKLALDAENDELVHKAVLDRVFLNGTARDARDARVADAHDVLVNQDTFAFVVHGLTLFSTRGAGMTPDEVATLVRAVNQDRCPYVLPAIDAYLGAAEGAVPGGDASLRAVRPTNC